MIKPEKWLALRERMKQFNIEESLIKEQFILGSGKGGQKQNKTASCVQLEYKPSGHVIKCQKTRSRELNRYYARKELVDKIEEEILGQKSRKQQEREKIRRQKRRRSKRAKEKILADKAARGKTKALRQKPDNLE